MQTTKNQININEVFYNEDKIIKYDLTKFEEDQTYDDYKYANYPYIYFEFPEINDLKIVLTQDFRLNKGGTFWDGSLLLAKYFLATTKIGSSEENNKINILELGAGTSLPGMLAALLDYNVILTDLGLLMKFIEKNISLNFPEKNSKTIKLQKLEWANQDDMKTIKGSFDFIFGSEIIYIEETFEDLIATMKYYSSLKTKIILVYKIRLPERTAKFFRLLSEEFDYVEIGQVKLQEYLRHPDLHLVVATLKNK